MHVIGQKHRTEKATPKRDSGAKCLEETLNPSHTGRYLYQ